MSCGYLPLPYKIRSQKNPSIGLSQGLRKSVLILALIKLKKAERWAYLMRLVCCFLKVALIATRTNYVPIRGSIH